MTDVLHGDHSHIVVNGVDNPVIGDSDPVEARTGQPHRADGSRTVAEVLNGILDALPVRHRQTVNRLASGTPDHDCVRTRGSYDGLWANSTTNCAAAVERASVALADCRRRGTHAPNTGVPAVLAGRSRECDKGGYDRFGAGLALRVLHPLRASLVLSRGHGVHGGAKTVRLDDGIWAIPAAALGSV